MRIAVATLMVSLLAGAAVAQTPSTAPAPAAPSAMKPPAAAAPAAPAAPPRSSTASAPKPPAASTAPSTQFKDEAAAKEHCPTDTVVWVNLSAKVYHLAGTRYYGKTKKGAYVCKNDADQSGFRVVRGELVKPAPATKP
jgi:hypothetical protein